MNVGASAVSAFERTRSRLRTDMGTPTGRAVLALFVASLVAPMVLSGYWQDVLIQMLVYVLLVASWNFIAGYFGMFTFGHAAIFGIGGYGTAIFAAEAGLPILPAILVGGVLAGIATLPIMLPVLRLESHYIAMVTVAYAEIIHLAAIHFREITGGPTGYTGYAPIFGGNRMVFVYWLVGFVALMLLLMYALLVSRFGLVARAIRESEDAAQMLGNNTLKYKVAGFFTGSAFAGVAGGLQAYNIMIISPPMLDLLTMVEIAAMGIVGGFRSLSGAVFGVVVVFGLSEVLRPFGELRLVVWGVLLLVAVLFFPNGIAGTEFGRRVRRLRN
jgi:branched-chain amino acid transport system permease protein